MICQPLSSDIRFWSSGDTKTGPLDGLLMGALLLPLERCFIGGCRVVGQAKSLLDKECTKGQAYGLCWGASGGAELRSIGFFQLFPWHQGGEEHPAIVWVQHDAKSNMELLD